MGAGELLAALEMEAGDVDADDDDTALDWPAGVDVAAEDAAEDELPASLEPASFNATTVPAPATTTTTATTISRVRLRRLRAGSVAGVGRG